MELLKDGVLCSPGTAFGPSGEGHLRFAFTISQEDISRGMDKVEATLKRLKNNDVESMILCNSVFDCRIFTGSSDPTCALHGALSNFWIQQRISSTSRTDSTHASSYPTCSPHALVPSTWNVHNIASSSFRIPEHSWWSIHLWIRAVPCRWMDAPFTWTSTSWRSTGCMYARDGTTACRL